MTTKKPNNDGLVEDSTIAEGMAYIEKPFRETPVKGLKKLFTSKTKEILKGEKMAEQYQIYTINRNIIEQNSPKYQQELKKEEEKKIKEKQEKLAEEKWAKENPEDAERVRLFQEFCKTGPDGQDLEEVLCSALKYKNSVYKSKVIELALNRFHTSYLLAKGIELDDEELIKECNINLIKELQEAAKPDYLNYLIGINLSGIFEIKSEKYDDLLNNLQNLFVKAWQENGYYNEQKAYDLPIKVQKLLAENFPTYDLPQVKIRDLDDEKVYEYIKNIYECGENKYNNPKLSAAKKAIEKKYGNCSIFCSKIIELKGAEVLSSKYETLIYSYGGAKIVVCCLDAKIDFLSPKALEIVAKEIIERANIKLGWFNYDWEETQKQIEEVIYSSKDKPELQKAAQDRIDELKNDLWEKLLKGIKDELKKLSSYKITESAMQKAQQEKIEELKKEYYEKIHSYEEKRNYAQNLKKQLMK